MRTTLYTYFLFLFLLCVSGPLYGQTIHNAADFTIGTGFPDSYSRTSCVVRQPDDKLLIGGAFIHYDVTSVNSLCRLHPDGSIDSSFHFNSSYAQVNDVAIQADGKIVVVGNFSEWDSVVCNSIVRLNADGTIDTTFLSGDGFDGFPGFWMGYVYDVVIQDDGKIITAGQFSSYDGVPRYNIARLNTDGTLDTTYNPGQYIDFESSMGQSVAIFTLALQSGGELIAGGVFDSYGVTARSGLARLHTDGTLDSTYAPVFELDPTLNVGTVPSMLSSKLLPGDTLLIGGFFTEVNGNLHTSIVRLLPSGATDESFVTSNDLYWANSVLGQVEAIDVQDNGRIVLAGAFDSYEGTACHHLMRLMPDGSTDYGFHLDELSDEYNDARLRDVCVLSDSTLIIVGTFTSVQNENRRYIAKLDACGSFSIANEVSCDAYLWPANSTTYTESGTYYATLPNGDGCDSVLLLNLTIPNLPNLQEICIAGLDSLTNKNRIVWEKPLSLAIDSFYVYRETAVTDVYERIGATDYEETGVFIDDDANPAVQAYRYKLSVLDTCGRETERSITPHQTVHLMINQGMGSTWNLIWTPYEGIAVPTYHIYRGTTPGNMTLLASVSGSMTSYSDLAAPDSVYYQVAFVNPYDCDPSKAIDYSSSRSNIATNGPASADEASAPLFNLYPNPAESELTIQMTAATGTIAIYSVIGAKVLEQTVEQQQTTLNIQQLAPGMYTLVVDSGNGIQERRFVKR